MNLSAAQAITLLVAVLLVAACRFRCSASAPRSGSALLVGGPLAAVALVRRDGFPLVEWAPIVWHFWRRRWTRQIGFRVTAAPRAAGKLALPGEEARLLTLTAPDGSVVVHDPWTGGYTSIMRVRAPAFLLLDPETQDAQVAGWGRVQAGLCQSNLISRAQVLELCVPDSGDGLRDYYAQHAHGQDLSDVGDRELPGPDGRRRPGVVPQRSPDRPDPGLASGASRWCGSPAAGTLGALKVLAGQRRVVEGALGASSACPSRGGSPPADLAYEMRCAYDPAIRPVLDYRPTAGRDLATAGPMAVQEHWDYLRTDTAFHSRAVADRMAPQPGVPDVPGPAGADPGDRPAADACCTSRSRPVKAMKQVQHDKTELISNAHDKQKLGQVANLADADELSDTLQREAEINAGHGDMGYAGLLVVSGPTLDELTLAVGAVRQAAIQAGCEARVLAGQQMQAFAAAALPLTRGF